MHPQTCSPFSLFKQRSCVLKDWPLVAKKRMTDVYIACEVCFSFLQVKLHFSLQTKSSSMSERCQEHLEWIHGSHDVQEGRNRAKMSLHNERLDFTFLSLYKHAIMSLRKWCNWNESRLAQKSIMHPYFCVKNSGNFDDSSIHTHKHKGYLYCSEAKRRKISSNPP